MQLAIDQPMAGRKLAIAFNLAPAAAVLAQVAEGEMLQIEDQREAWKLEGGRFPPLSPSTTPDGTL